MKTKCLLVMTSHCEGKKEAKEECLLASKKQQDKKEAKEECLLASKKQRGRAISCKLSPFSRYR